MPRISPPATSPSPAQKKPSAAHGLTHPRAPQRAPPCPFAQLPKKEEADEIFTRRPLLLPLRSPPAAPRRRRGGGGGGGILRKFLTKDFGTALRQRQATVLVYLSHPCFQSRDFGRVQFCERKNRLCPSNQQCPGHALQAVDPSCPQAHSAAG